MSSNDRVEAGPQFVPPEILPAGWLRCRLIEEGDVARLYDAVVASRADLRQWMPWAADDYTIDMAEEFISAQLRLDGQLAAEAVYVPYDADHPFLGSFGLHARLGPGVLEIGYWVDSRQTRRGVATLTTALLTEAALSIPGIDRVEVHHDEANRASGGVPRRLGYTLIDSVKREPEAPGEIGVNCRWQLHRSDWPSSAGARLLTSVRAASQ
ncbi:GNAT family protein [Ferrimicrobium sp.]|uniref:GNAT family N-acetyltransferase n=1 Tax=Ferrimicrobium sp. TaxID=2926050 RepID=UPI002628ED00|nr:GNAT family protein [Ferrimicrobium sp.]